MNILRAKSLVGAMTTNLGMSNKIRKEILVEDRNTTQLAAVPFGLVFCELRVDRLQEWAHEGNLVCRTDN